MEIMLSRDVFEKFVKCMDNFKLFCSNIDIRGGFVRQRVDNSTFVFEIDLNSIIGNSDIQLFSLKDKVELLKIFLGNDVKFNVENNSFSVSDHFSSIIFRAISDSYIGPNKFIDKEEFEKILDLKNYQNIFSINISSEILKRINQLRKKMEVENVVLKISNNNATFLIPSPSKEKFVKIFSDTVVESKIEGETFLPNVFFSLGDTASLDFFINNKYYCINILKTKIEDLSVTLYSRSGFMKKE